MNRNDKTHKLTPVEEAIRYFDPYPHPVLRMMAEDYESRQRKKNKFDGEGDSNIEKTSKEDYSLSIPEMIDAYLYGNIMEGIRVGGNAFTVPGFGIALGPLSGTMGEITSSVIPNFGDRKDYKGGTAQRTFLMSRENQRKNFLHDGYLIGKTQDYGPLADLAELHSHKEWYKHKDGSYDPLPVYQTMADAVDPKRLYAIPKYYPTYHIDNREADLHHAASYLMQYFVDRPTGNIYQKGWDLNDYGHYGNSGGYSSHYWSPANYVATTLDYYGNPVVVTTGFQPVAGVKENATYKKKQYSPLYKLLFSTKSDNSNNFKDREKQLNIQDIARYPNGELYQLLSNLAYPNKSDDPNEPLEAVLPLREVEVIGQHKH